jgi:hypothetical protein
LNNSKKKDPSIQQSVVEVIDKKGSGVGPHADLPVHIASWPGND